MNKSVVMLPRSQTGNVKRIVDDLRRLPGVKVSEWSSSFISVDFEGDVPQRLRDFLDARHLSLHQEPEAELMEPIDPFKAL